MQKTLILAATTALLAACSNADTSTATTEPVQIVETTVMTDAASTDVMTSDVAMETKTKAVLVYADWCGSCKVLDPKIKAVQAMGPMPGVEFVTLDYTDKDADNFYAQAKAAGVEEAVRAELDGTIKTGWLLLVDVDDKRVLSKVTKADETAEIVTKIQDALAQS